MEQAYSEGDSKVNNLHFKISDIEINYEKPIYITIPFPKDYFFEDQKLSILFEKSPISFSAYSHLYWPSINNKKRSVRAITIKMLVAINGDYILIWDDINGKNLSLKPIKADFIQNTHIPSKWLGKLSYADTLSLDKDYNLKWFDESFVHYGKYVTNEKEIQKVEKKSYSKNKASPWLYDKVFTLYQLYFKTGDLKWKHKAHQEALFYANNINSRGYFTLKDKDMKYLNGSGLLYDYIFFPDNHTLRVISRMYKNTLSWPVTYPNERGFWTERHLSVALNMAITQWEANQMAAPMERINDLIKGTFNILQNFSEPKSNCLKHTYASHEGGEYKALMCSPWMTALVTEQIWRFNFLFKSEDSYKIIMRFSDFILNEAVYKWKNKPLDGFVVPDYIVLFIDGGYRDRNKWTDIHHACDVAGMLAKGVYLKKINKVEYKKHNYLLEDLLKTCKATVNLPSKKYDYWVIKPRRKFNWWFGSTTNLSWLYEEINKN